MTGKHSRTYYALLFVALSLVLHICGLVSVIWLIPKDKKDRRALALQVWTTEPKNRLKTDESQKTVVSLASPNDQTRPKEANFLAKTSHSTDKETSARLKNASTQTQKQPMVKHFLKKHQSNTADPLGIKQPINYGKNNTASSSKEYVLSKEQGDETKLNAWEWRHAPFFERVKARIGQAWAPQTHIARYDPEGRLLGHKNRITVMSVTIDRQGNLAQLSVLQTSGIAYLDEAAEKAVRDAVPFSFPPKELFGEQSEFSFSFAFHLHVTRGFSFDFH